MRGFPFERLRGQVLCAVNDAILHIPNAAALFSLDRNWINNRRREIEAFAGERYLAVAEDYRMDLGPEATYLLRIRSRPGLSENAEQIYIGGGNSGFGAFNLTFLKGARRIVLLGFDFRDAGSHWHQGYQWSGGENRSKLYANWAAMFAHTLPQLRHHGVQVWNASSKSLIDCFPKISLDTLPLQEAA